jgi:multidrug efflux pump subunit AcrB
MPAGITIATLTDRTGTIRASLGDVQMTLLITSVLVVVLVFLFLRRMTPTMAVALTVPLSIAGTVGVMALAGYSLDNLSLMALTVSIGFVVDDAIVMIENISRHRELGKSALGAAIDGAGEIGFTVISISISLIAVFIPLLLMGGLVGRLFREFAVTLSVAIAVSAVVSLTLTPMLCGQFMSAGSAVPSRLGTALERPVTWLRDRYAAALNVVLRHQRIGILATIGTIVLTLALYVAVPKGFFPDQDTGLILGITQAAPDLSFAAMSEKQQLVADLVLGDQDVDAVGSFIGIGAGNASMNEGRVFINLKPLQQRTDHARVTAIITRLRQRLRVLPGITLYMQAVQDIQVGGRLGKGEYQFTLTDTDLDELNTWMPRIVAALSTIPGVLDAASDQEPTGARVSVTVDRTAAARLGVSMSQVDAVLDDGFSQRQISTIYTASDTYHVVLTLASPWVQQDATLSRLYVSAANGTQVPLSAFARVQRTTAPLTVTHDGQFPSATVTFNLGPNLPIGTAVGRIQTTLKQLSPPATLHAAFEGSAAAFRQSLASEKLLLLAAIVSIYIVLGVLYENMVHPLTILSALPTAGIGALISLWLAGDALTIIGLIGIILLMGIVKKNAIMLVDFAIEAERRDRLPPVEAVRQACLTRLRPILMTSLAALLGALPLALGTGSGSELRQPLGVAIVGGLLFSQVLTLFTTPIVYLALGRLFGTRVGGPLVSSI